MKNDHTQSRRYFFKACASVAGLIATQPKLLANTNSRYKPYNKVLLVDSQGEPLSAKTLDTNQCFIFQYPYKTTPCFLLNLEQSITSQQMTDESGQAYEWPGGAGPNQSIVGFSAICAHKLSYPTKTASFINFRSEDITFHKQDQQTETRKNTIYCCSERSVYDPAKGAEVLGGPAPAPLTSIILEYQSDDDLIYAVGTSGTEQYDRFFEKFEFRLQLDNKIENVLEQPVETTQVLSMDEYSAHNKVC